MYKYTKEEKKVIKKLIKDLQEYSVLQGKYDAKHGSEKYMHGVSTVLELAAYRVGEEYANELMNKFYSEMIESKKRWNID